MRKPPLLAFCVIERHPMFSQELHAVTLVVPSKCAACLQTAQQEHLPSKHRIFACSCCSFCQGVSKQGLSVWDGAS